MGIDLNRGVTHRKHPQGFNVYMYKDRPGDYYDAHEKPLSDKIASDAGFDVQRLKIEAQKLAMKSDAMASIEAQFVQQSAMLDTLIERVQPGGEYAVRDLGRGKWQIESADGEFLLDDATDEKTARGLLAQVTKVTPAEIEISDALTDEVGAVVKEGAAYRLRHKASIYYQLIDEHGEELLSKAKPEPDLRRALGKALGVAPEEIEVEPKGGRNGPSS